MLEVKNLDVYYGKVQALYDINIKVEEGKITNMVGANGSGKTTLMKCISGLLKPERGSITLDEEQVEGLPPHEIVERGIVQVPEGRKLFPSLTVEENLEMGSIHERAKQKRSKSLGHVYDLFPLLLERKHQLAGTLSGGEQQMLAFGRALMSIPKVLLLDEPSLGLSPIVVREIFKTVQKINNDGGTILLVEQNVKASLALADWNYVIETGKVIAEGKSKELIANEKILKAYFGITQHERR